MCMTATVVLQMVCSKNRHWGILRLMSKHVCVSATDVLQMVCSKNRHWGILNIGKWGHLQKGSNHCMLMLSLGPKTHPHMNTETEVQSLERFIDTRSDNISTFTT